MSAPTAEEQDFIPGPVLLLGPPGVGKGTQAQILMEQWGVPQVSTGDLIRENIRQGTAVGRNFQEMVAAGIYVPDDVVNQMVAERTAQPDCRRGFILDGFPRTLGQAEWVDTQLIPALNWTWSEPQGLPGERLTASSDAGTVPRGLLAILISVRYDELLRRITGRRTGPISKRIYNIYSNPPASPGICDVDGEPLEQRPDDTEEVFTERMRVFHEQTQPVVDHYRALGRFQQVDGEQSVEAVTGQIIATLMRMRNSETRTA